MIRRWLQGAQAGPRIRLGMDNYKVTEDSVEIGGLELAGDPVAVQDLVLLLTRLPNAEIKIERA